VHLGITLPGALDIECKLNWIKQEKLLNQKPDNPNGAECYGLSASAMVSWIKDFSDTYNAKTGR
jgi:hypothetical protein